MPQDGVFDLTEVLSAEFGKLRPESGYTELSDAASLFRTVHGEKKPLTALCISGGGIRSATFALGAIQGLAEEGLLEDFDYLSTVSGGGYLGGWLTSWKHRAGGLAKIIPFLRRQAAPIPTGAPDPVQHLREYNNYLSPKLGLFSADTWTLVATVVRNMFLNWLVFIPLLMAALLIPRLVLSIASLDPNLSDAVLNVFSGAIFVASAGLFAIGTFNMMRYLPGVGGRPHSEIDFLKWVLLPVVLATVAFVANDSWFADNPSESSQFLRYPEVIAGVTVPVFAACLACLVVCHGRLKGRFLAWLGITVAALLSGGMGGTTAWWLANHFYAGSSWPAYTTLAAPALLLALTLAGCVFVGLSSRQLKDEDREWLSRAGAWVLLYVASWSGLCTLVLFVPGWILQLGPWIKSALAATGGLAGWMSALAGYSTHSGATRGSGAQQSTWYTRLGTALAAPVFAVIFLAALAIVTNWVFALTGLGPFAWWNHEALLEGTRVWSIVLAGAILLLTSWLMARFININKFSLQAMYRNRLIRAYLGASNPSRDADSFTGFANSDNLEMRKLDAAQKPLHLVNVTLNLVAGRRLAWQERKAESFTISPLHCGSADLGYRPSDGYADAITLGTAVAISGAAASPNMGYHSSPVIAFIMTLFNARLGSWLGNPGEAGAKAWKQAGPTSATGSLVREALGLTNDTSRWVYLSDGGHFENLALYEMVRRRCRYIVVLDGGCDPDFTYGDLGNALRKIRIDLKIPVEFDAASFQGLRNKTARFALARIRYDAVDEGAPDGYLVYAKPLICGNEAPDVASYYADHPDFPHESTADQFFNESRTESYRALGAQTIAEICREWDGRQGLSGVVTYLLSPKKAAAAS
jgi:hypothetical protein